MAFLGLPQRRRLSSGRGGRRGRSLSEPGLSTHRASPLPPSVGKTLKAENALHLLMKRTRGRKVEVNSDPDTTLLVHTCAHTHTPRLRFLTRTPAHPSPSDPWQEVSLRSSWSVSTGSELRKPEGPDRESLGQERGPESLLSRPAVSAPPPHKPLGFSVTHTSSWDQPTYRGASKVLFHWLTPKSMSSP